MDPRDVILEPVVSEKSYNLLDEGAYTFKVHPEANKLQIRQAIESIFDVKVLKVTTATLPSAARSDRAERRASCTIFLGVRCR